MKGIFVALVAAVLLCGCQSVRQNETKPAISKEECAMSMQKTCQFSLVRVSPETYQLFDHLRSVVLGGIHQRSVPVPIGCIDRSPRR